MQDDKTELAESGCWMDDMPWFCYTESYYIKMPKALLTNPAYQTLSLRAKVCYALLLDRVRLSYSNGWLDKDNNYYVYYTVESLAKMLGCTTTSCTQAYRELERANLCKRTRQGQGKPSRVVVYPVVEPFNLRIKTAKE